MKIIIAHFGTYYVNMAGGVEKVTCNLANALVKRGHEVTILYRDKVEGDPYFLLDKRVKQYNILFDNGRKVVSEKLPFRLRLIREAVRTFSQSAAQGINAKYKGQQYGPRIRAFLDTHPADIVLSCSIPSAKYVITDASCTLPVVEMIHSHPRVQFPDLSEVEKEAVRKCKAMQILLPSGLKLAHQYFPGLPIRVIGNAVFPPKKLASSGEPKKRYVISCVGNISDTKRQQLLCEAFGKLAHDYSDWRVEFWGSENTGHAKKMRSWIEQHNLGGQILMKGKTNHIEDVYAYSDIFCLPSRGEGWGLALSEAMAAGVPAVGFKGVTGVEDLIQDGFSGLLAVNGDIDSLAEKLKRLMDSARLRREYGQNAREQMKQYAPEKIWDAWERLLQDVLAGRV